MSAGPMTDEVKQKWAASVVAACFGDENLHQEFMATYKKGRDPMKALLTGPKFNMPAGLADEILAKEDQVLSDQIGKWICDWLW